MTNKDIAGMIDHTILKATAQKADVEKLCTEAKNNSFASVCVNPVWVKMASELLKGKNNEGHHVKTCTVIGFPLGANGALSKASETAFAIADGAEEVDMVIDVGAVKDHRWEDVKKDIEAVVKAARTNGDDKGNHVCVKVILENCYLTKEEIVEACKCAVEADVDFVKTSTGFGSSGAKAEDVKLMREIVGPNIGVKAAGGIRDKKTLLEMVEAGANRIGCSAGIAILAE